MLTLRPSCRFELRLGEVGFLRLCSRHFAKCVLSFSIKKLSGSCKLHEAKLRRHVGECLPGAEQVVRGLGLIA